MPAFTIFHHIRVLYSSVIHRNLAGKWVGSPKAPYRGQFRQEYEVNHLRLFE